MVHTERSLPIYCLQAASKRDVRLVGFEICAGKHVSGGAAAKHGGSDGSKHGCEDDVARKPASLPLLQSRLWTLGWAGATAEQVATGSDGW